MSELSAKRSLTYRRFTDLLQIGIEIDRGNSESANKSDRVGKAWKRKKENAGNGLALTSVVPAWLKAVKGQPPVVIPEHAATVRKSSVWLLLDL